MPSIDIVTVHFGDIMWSERLVRNCLRFHDRKRDPLSIRRLLIVDNERRDAARAALESLADIVRVMSFPTDPRHVRLYGHEHGSAVEQVLRFTEADVVLLLDNDAHPIVPGYLRTIDVLLAASDAIAAQDHRSPGSSHPCYMAFRRDCFQPPLQFDTWEADHCDIGRSIRRQLEQRGRRVHVASETVPFDGRWGNVFDGIVYHHGSGSFPYSQRHANMVHPYAAFFADRVLRKRRYALTLADRLYLAVHSRWRRIRGLAR